MDGWMEVNTRKRRKSFIVSIHLTKHSNKHTYMTNDYSMTVQKKYQNKKVGVKLIELIP